LAFCNITVELFSQGLCSRPPENRSVAPKGARGPRLRNHGLTQRDSMSGSIRRYWCSSCQSPVDGNNISCFTRFKCNF